MSFFVYPDVLKYDIINTSKYRKGEAMKKLLSTITAAVIMLTAFSIVPSAGAASTNAADYTYTITPILSPFNEYFFVKTDNPNPFSFRFADKSTIYADSDYIAMPGSSGSITLYADVNYEDTSTGRVNGGYIFRSNSYNTDGGEIVLQTKSGSTWTDTSVKYDLPALRDNVDYLIDTYADYNVIKQLVENKQLDQKYLDMVTITRSQAENMDLDKNTNTLPAQGFSFDGKSAPGTPFTNSTALRGDINNDGKITIDDATKLQRYIARIDSAAGDETFTARADVNGDGNVNIVDVTEIQRYLAGCGNPHKIGEAV